MSLQKESYNSRLCDLPEFQEFIGLPAKDRAAWLHDLLYNIELSDLQRQEVLEFWLLSYAEKGFYLAKKKGLDVSISKPYHFHPRSKV